MILIRISDNNEQEIEKIAEMLLEKRLIMDVIILRGIERWEHHDDSIVKSEVTLLTAKTKALLFPKIDKILRKAYPDAMPELFSLPIVNMDWEQSKHLVEEVIPT